MDISHQTLILMNPNGTIQIGTQPWLDGKKMIKCYHCKANVIFDANLDKVKCTGCGVANQVPRV